VVTYSKKGRFSVLASRRGIPRHPLNAVAERGLYLNSALSVSAQDSEASSALLGQRGVRASAQKRSRGNTVLFGALTEGRRKRERTVLELDAQNHRGLLISRKTEGMAGESPGIARLVFILGPHEVGTQSPGP